MVAGSNFVFVYQFLALAQERLKTTFGDYKLPWMLAGLSLLGASALGFYSYAREHLPKENRWTVIGVGAGGVGYLATFFATSFIEEEHEFWYFATTTLLLLLAGLP